MSTALLFRLLICCALTSLLTYVYLDRNNRLTELRLDLPQLADALEGLREENAQLQYERDRFNSPLHLMTLAEKPECRHLRHPRLSEVIILESEEER